MKGQNSWFKTGVYGPIWARVGELRDYLAEMESKFDFDSGPLNQGMAAEIKKSPVPDSSHDDIYDNYSDQFYRIDYIFRYIFRYSAVVAVYSLLESSMAILCLAIKRSKNYEVEVNDMRGNGIEQARLYLEKVHGVKFPENTHVWNEIQKLNRIRNCIVHAEGNIQRTKSPSKIRNIVEQTKGLSLEHEDYIRIDKQYVQDAAGWIEEFLKDIFDKSLERA